VTLLVLNQAPLASFLHQHLITEHIYHVLLAFSMIIEVVLDLMCKDHRRQIVCLQSIYQVDDLDVIELVIASLREIDKLAARLLGALRPLFILGLELRALVRVEHVKNLLNFGMIIGSLNKLLRLQVEMIELFTLVVDALFHLLPDHLLVHQLFMKEAKVLLHFVDLCPALLCVVCMLLSDVIKPESGRSNLLEFLRKHCDFYVFLLLLQAQIVWVDFHPSDVVLNLF